MDISLILPIELLFEIGVWITDYPSYVAYISTCKKINSIDKDIRKSQTKIREIIFKDSSTREKPREVFQEFKGVKHGFYHKYSHRVKIIECLYRNGRLHGEYVQYQDEYPEYFKDKGYMIIEKSSYQDGKLHGHIVKWRYMFHNKKVPVEDSYYKNGIINGISIIRGWTGENKETSIFKYLNGICISRCLCTFKSEACRYILDTYSNIDFDYVLPDIPEYMFDITFIHNGIRYLVDLDSIRNGYACEGQMDLIYICNIKTNKAIELGHRVIRLGYNGNLNNELFRKHIKLAMFLGDQLYFNEDSAYNDFIYRLENNPRLGLDYFVYKKGGIRKRDKDYEFIDDHLNRSNTNNRDENNNENNESWPPEGTTFDELVEPFKSLVMRHVQINIEINEIQDICNFLISEMKDRKTYTKTGDDSFLESIANLIYNCYLYMGCGDYQHYTRQVKWYLHKLIEKEIDVLYHPIYYGPIDDEGLADIMGSQIEEFKHEYVYEQVSCMPQLPKKYNNNEINEDEWKLSRRVELRRNDIVILDRFVNKLINLVIKHISILNEGQIDIENLLIITDNFIKSVNIVRSNPLYISLLK